MASQLSAVVSAMTDPLFAAVVVAAASLAGTVKGIVSAGTAGRSAVMAVNVVT